MTTPDRPPSGGSPVQPWTPGPPPTGVTCPACGLANEPGVRTCRNCGLPIASADDPVRGVAPGRVELPKARKSGLSATIGFVMVLVLLVAGGSLAVSGGGGLLSGGGRLGVDATPSPTPLRVVDGEGEAVAVAEPTEVPSLPAGRKPNMATFSCENGAIKDLSRGKWFLADVQAGTRTSDEGERFDQIYWRMDRQNRKKVKAANATTVTMQWSSPDQAKERFGDAIGRVPGDEAIILTFDGPVSITVNDQIEQSELEAEDIDQVRRVQLFEHKGKVRSVVGLRGDSCARLGSVGWGAKSTRDNVRVVLDVERFE